MRDDVRHATDKPRVGRCAVGMKESCYAAHTFKLLSDRHRLKAGAGRAHGFHNRRSSGIIDRARCF